MDEIRLIRDRSELRHTQYFELLPGAYRGECWNEGSAFIDEEAFTLLEKVVGRHVSEFDHYAFVNAPREQWLPLLQELQQLAHELEAATDLEDVREKLEFLFRDSEERFAADFARNAHALAQMVREIVEWVGEQLKTHDGVAILGI
jgi:hypothetical protein